MIFNFTLLWDKVIVLLTLCFQDIMSCSYMLKCNPKKTEIIHFSSLFSPAEPVPSIKVGHCLISLSNEVKDLGVKLDRHLPFKTHINNICRSASPSTHLIGKIRNLLSTSTTKRRIHEFVSSKQINTTAFFTAYPPTSYRIYNGCNIQPQGELLEQKRQLKLLQS